MEGLGEIGSERGWWLGFQRGYNREEEERSIKHGRGVLLEE